MDFMHRVVQWGEPLPRGRSPTATAITIMTTRVYCLTSFTCTITLMPHNSAVPLLDPFYT